MITSPDNPTITEIRKLAGRKWRDKLERFVAEGEDLLSAAAAAGWEPVVRLESGVDVEPRVLAGVSSLGSGTRVLAVYAQRWAPAAEGPLCVSLWGVADPGNVGTVLRSAHAFGASCVALGPGTADPYGPKAVRASMGAIFSVPLVRLREPGELPGRVVGLAAREGRPLRELDPGPLSLAIGAEREGLPPEVVAACDELAHIPIQTESLNAAMAATVALYEAAHRMGEHA